MNLFWIVSDRNIPTFLLGRIENWVFLHISWNNKMMYYLWTGWAQWTAPSAKSPEGNTLVVSRENNLMGIHTNLTQDSIKVRTAVLKTHSCTSVFVLAPVHPAVILIKKCFSYFNTCYEEGKVLDSISAFGCFAVFVFCIK